MQDPKAWVRQWIAIMMTVGLISCAAIEMLTTVSIPTWFLMLASGCITWFFGSREIEELQREKGGKIKEARIELKKIEIEKNNFQIVNIKKIAKDKLNEALVFYKVYQKYKKFDEMDTAELAKHEEENWKIKSVYYPELPERYGLTPSGFLKLPHENGGLNALIALQKKALNPPKGKEK